MPVRVVGTTVFFRVINMAYEVGVNYLPAIFIFKFLKAAASTPITERFPFFLTHLI